MAERAERIEDRAVVHRFWEIAEQDGDRDEGDGHQRSSAEERAAPADAAELAAEQWAGGDPEPERRLVEDDRAGQAAARRPDDRRQRGRDAARVAEAPAGA